VLVVRAHFLDVTTLEMQTITAANYLGGKYLTGCTLYVTLEPCQMCAGFVLSQISKLCMELDENAVL
jgi:tRNA(adenine34) deaminase